jgi:hypothetical protein
VKLLSIALALLGCSAIASAQAPVCPLNTIVSGTASAVVIPINAKTIRICKVVFNVVQSATPINFSLISGTGSVCGTGTAQVTQIYTGVASSTQAYDQSVDGTVAWIAGAAGSAVCVSLSGAPTGASVQVFYGILR